MRENRTSGSEGGEAQTNELSLPLSPGMSRAGEVGAASMRRSDRTTEGPPTLGMSRAGEV